MFLAYLPFMVYPYDLFRTGIAALWIALFLWFTVTFFWFTSRFFPKRSLKHAFFLWLLVWAQAVWTLTKLPPYWVVSVFFLTPVSFLDDKAKPEHVRVFSRQVPRYFFERALAGAGFAGFVIGMAIVREICEKRLGMQAFDQPAGMLLVSAAVAFLWENQPYRVRARRSPRETPRKTEAIPVSLAGEEQKSGRE